MNKSTLFLFSIFSTINFSCGAMEMAEYGAYQVEQGLKGLIQCAYGAKTERFEKNYRTHLQEFNTRAESLKQLCTNKTRWSMVNNLNVINQGISFLRREKSESFRICCVNTFIDILNNTKTTLDSEIITNYQDVINIMADFTISKNCNSSLENSEVMSVETYPGKKILTQEMVESLKNKKLLELFDSKKEEIAEREKFVKKHYEHNKQLEQSQIVNNRTETGCGVLQIINDELEILPYDPMGEANIDKIKDTIFLYLTHLDNQKSDLQQDKVAGLIKINQKDLTELKDKVTALELQIIFFNDAKKTWENETKDLRINVANKDEINEKLIQERDAALKIVTKYCNEATTLKKEIDIHQTIFQSVGITSLASLAAFLFWYFSLHTKCQELLSKLNHA